MNGDMEAKPSRTAWWGQLETEEQRALVGERMRLVREHRRRMPVGEIRLAVYATEQGRSSEVQWDLRFDETPYQQASLHDAVEQALQDTREWLRDADLSLPRVEPRSCTFCTRRVDRGDASTSIVLEGVGPFAPLLCATCAAVVADQHRRWVNNRSDDASSAPSGHTPAGVGDAT